MSIWIAQNLLDPESKWAHFTKQNALEYLEKCYKARTPPHSFEVVKKNQPVRIYFDIDCGNWADLDPEGVERQVIEALIDYAGIAPSSICTSHGKNKLSWHLTVPMQSNRQTIKNFVDFINPMITHRIGIPNLLDRKVYADGIQRWRLLGCTKPPSGINNPDPEQRKKTLSLGNPEDTLISHIEDLPIWVCPIPSNPRLKWLYAISRECVFQEPLKEWMGNYETWRMFGSSIYVEAKKSNELYNGFHLFNYLSMKCRDKYNPEECSKKFYNDFTSIQVSEFPKIKQMFTKKVKWACEFYEPFYKDTLEVISNPPLQFQPVEELVEKASEEVDLESLKEFLVYDSYQYRLVQHLVHTSSTLLDYWTSQIQSFEDLEIFYLLTLSGPNPSQNKEIQKVHGLIEKAYDRFSENVVLPFDITKRWDCTFGLFKVLAEVFAIDYKEDLLSEWVKTPFDDAKSKQVEEQWSKYKEYAIEKDGDLYFDVEKRIEHLFIWTLAECEDAQYMQRFQDWFVIRDPVWSTRVPYYTLLQEIKSEIDPNPLTFLESCLSHYVDRFKADRVFGYWTRCYSDVAGANIVFQLYPHWMKVAGTLMVYDDMTGIWTKDEDNMLRIISRFANLLQHTDKLNMGDSWNLRNTILKEIRCIESICLDQTQYQNIINSTEHLLLAPNGYFNGKENLFHGTPFICGKRVFTWPKLLFFHSLPDPILPSPTNEALQEEIYQTFFGNLYSPQTAQFVLENIATALFGVKKKEYYVFFGDTGTGKSTIKQFMEAAFGQLAGTTDLNKFRYNPKDPDSRKIAFIYENATRRFLLVSEGHCILCTELIKQAVSGGLDRITARKEFKSDQLFDIFFRLFIFNNNMPEFSHVDNGLIDRTCIVNLKNQFAKTIVDDTVQMLANDNIDDWKSSPAHRQAFVSLLITAYLDFQNRGYEFLPRPDELAKENPNAIGEMNLPIDLFKPLMYELVFHGQPGVWITLEEFKQACDRVIPHSGSTAGNKVQSIMQKLNIPNTTIKSKVIKVKGKSIRVWEGISLRAEIMSSCESLYLTDYEKWQTYMRENNGILDEEFLARLQNAMKIVETRKRQRHQMIESPEATEEIKRFRLDS